MPSESPPSSRQTSPRALLRAALLGLSGGLLLGGLFMLAMSLRAHFSPLSCEDLSEEECGFYQDEQRELGRVQGMSGAALLALGLSGATLVLRMKTGAEVGASGGPPA